MLPVGMGCLQEDLSVASGNGMFPGRLKCCQWESKLPAKLLVKLPVRLTLRGAKRSQRSKIHFFTYLLINFLKPTKTQKFRFSRQFGRT
jgi:hypothetical protein